MHGAFFYLASSYTARFRCQPDAGIFLRVRDEKCLAGLQGAGEKYGQVMHYDTA